MPCWTPPIHRTRPVVLTAAATVLAMVPLTRSVFWGPMAIAIMGGLTIATLLTIFFVPALYAAWFRVGRAERAEDERRRGRTGARVLKDQLTSSEEKCHENAFESPDGSPCLRFCALGVRDAGDRGRTRAR